jgi:hypothetical protein
MPPHGPFVSVLSLAKATLTGLVQQKTPPSDPPQIPLRIREGEPLREPREKKTRWSDIIFQKWFKRKPCAF